MHEPARPGGNPWTTPGVKRDAIIIVLIVAALLIIEIATDGVDTLIDWFAVRFSGVNEALGMLAILGVCSAVFAWRRWRESEQEIRSRQAAETEQHEAEERYRFLVEQIPAVTYLDRYAADSNIPVVVYISPQIESLLGYSQQAWMDDPALWRRLLHEDDRDAAIQEGEAAVREQRPYAADYRMRHPLGHVVWVRERASIIKDSDTGEELWQGTMYDISEEKESQQALREAEARYRGLFENALEGIFRTRLEDGRFLEVNPALATMFGYDSPSEMLRHVSSSAALYVNVAEREESVRKLVGGGFLRRVVQFRRRDNSTLWGKMGARLLESAGRPAEVEGTISDVTELRESAAEKQALLASLVSAQEEERHRIAGDIHDDPLQKVVAVGMRLGALRSRLDNPEHVALLQTLEESVQLASARLRNLLFELRPTSLDTSGLADALRELVHQTMSQEETRCVVDSKLVSEPGIETRAIAYRIAQEAIANARKHARAKVIRICLRNEGKGVSVSVADDGVGIDPEFTRRSAPGHMGLATMRERAQLAGGWIQVRSLPSGGTTVDFWVPDGAVEGDFQPHPLSAQRPP